MIGGEAAARPARRHHRREHESDPEPPHARSLLPVSAEQIKVASLRRARDRTRARILGRTTRRTMASPVRFRVSAEVLVIGGLPDRGPHLSEPYSPAPIREAREPGFLLQAGREPTPPGSRRHDDGPSFRATPPRRGDRRRSAPARHARPGTGGRQRVVYRLLCRGPGRRLARPRRVRAVHREAGDRPVPGRAGTCALAATIGNGGKFTAPTGSVTAGRAASPLVTTVNVATFDVRGRAADRTFHLVVAC